MQRPGERLQHDRGASLSAAVPVGGRIERLAEPVRRQRPDLAVECTGNAEGFEIARRAVRPRGTVVLKSTYEGRLSIDMAPVVVDEISLVGSRCGPFAPALDALARGTVDPAPLIDGRFELGNGVAAFERAEQPGVLKVLVDC